MNNNYGGSIYGSNNGILDPNSDFYKFDKHAMMKFKELSSNNHINTYEYNPKKLYFDGFEKINEPEHGYTFNTKDKITTSLNICLGENDNNCYDVIRNLSYYEPVARAFFSKQNVYLMQCKIKQSIYNETKGKIILEEDLDESYLLIAMRALYLQEGRFLPDKVDKIDHQVKRLNLKVINYIVPDIITNIKQQYFYIKEINSPIKPIDRPINDSVKGRKLLQSTFLEWKN